MNEILAHQGGWDEVAYFIIPLLVFAALLWRARRRIDDDDPTNDDPIDDDPIDDDCEEDTGT